MAETETVQIEELLRHAMAFSDYCKERGIPSDEARLTVALTAAILCLGMDEEQFLTWMRTGFDAVSQLREYLPNIMSQGPLS